MKEISIFIDESGDFGEYAVHSPYYIITMVFHDQSVDISNNISKLDEELDYLGLHDLCIHTGPIIRKEEIYKEMSIAERRKIFNKMVAFVRQLNISYKSFYIEKKHIDDPVEAAGKLSKQIAEFIKDHYSDFLGSDSVKIYYDNGQVQVSKILASVFSVLLPNPIFRKVLPKDYKLFQVADLLCTFTLIELKINDNIYSKTEDAFFGNRRDFKKNYLKHIKKKEWK